MAKLKDVIIIVDNVKTVFVAGLEQHTAQVVRRKLLESNSDNFDMLGNPICRYITRDSQVESLRDFFIIVKDGERTVEITVQASSIEAAVLVRNLLA
jgi:hypothetical protein